MTRKKFQKWRKRRAAEKALDIKSNTLMRRASESDGELREALEERA